MKDRKGNDLFHTFNTYLDYILTFQVETLLTKLGCFNYGCFN